MAGQPAAVSTIRLLISGAVQGVGFRYFVVRKAATLGLLGWARNLPDGRVEVVAKGISESLNLLHDAVSAGPPNARVVRVDRSEISDDAISSNAFEIK
jgi:acylphosphatase